MGQLCDAGCQGTFDAASVRVLLDGIVILRGERTVNTGLWHLTLEPTPAFAHPTAAACSCVTVPDTPVPHHCNGAIHSATPSELVAFSHAALFSPALSTLHMALERGFLSDIPGLTTKSLAKYPPASFAMVKGHLDQTRKNQRSTKPKSDSSAISPSPPDPSLACTFPSSETPNEHTHHCYAAIVNPSTGQIHTDQTGKFIVASSVGNNYIMVLYDYDSNAMLVEPMHNRTGPCILRAFQTLHARLVAAGLKPKLHRLDNECSAALKHFLTDADIDFQLVPPGRHASTQCCRTRYPHI